MTRQKLLYLMQYYVEKQVFSWRAKKVQICCIITRKSRFSHDARKNLYLMHLYVERRFSYDATENKVYIWCIITFRSRFSHDATKTHIFDALLHGKAVFLMTCQKGANLLHYKVEKQVFPLHAKNSHFWCINTWISRFFMMRPIKVYVWFIITFCSRFSHEVPKTLLFDA